MINIGNNLSPKMLMQLLSFGLIIMVVISLIVTVMFIMSQQKLVRKLSQKDQEFVINKTWLWTQLIPIWSYIALVIVTIKIDEQVKNHNETCNTKLKFKATTVYWYVGLTFLSFVPLLNFLTTIVSLILFIIVWSNISQTTKQLSVIAE